MQNLVDELYNKTSFIVSSIGEVNKKPNSYKPKDSLQLAVIERLKEQSNNSLAELLILTDLLNEISESENESELKYLIGLE